jgi:hypothetical protein
MALKVGDLAESVDGTLTDLTHLNSITVFE